MDIEDTREVDLQRLREMARADPGSLVANDIDKVLEKERLVRVVLGRDIGVIAGYI